MPFEPVPIDYPRDAPDYAPGVWVAALLAVDPGLGGVVIRARYGAARDAWLARFACLMPAQFKKMPPNIGDDRLLGGLDLSATLGAGRPVMMQGLLAAVAGGVLVLAMAERLPATTAARIAAAMDDGGGFGVVALDEGIDDEAPPPALLDRLAFTLAETALPAAAEPWPGAAQIQAARFGLRDVVSNNAVIERLAGLAAMFEIASPRAALFALRAARAAAALGGRTEIGEADVECAIALVLLPRARCIPAPDAADPAAGKAAGDDAPAPPGEGETGETEPDMPAMDDTRTVTPEAARAVLPPALLDALAAGQISRRVMQGGGGGGRALSLNRGRPAGVRPGRLGNGARLSVLETLRAAAPWQGVRKAHHRIAVRVEDFRIMRFKQRDRSLAIFAVDASGSAALNRLAEAKGAVQLLLADCYVRRDQVAVLAFRGRAAECLLPPTHALARARRGLAGLPGGGPTPLAIGIDAARALAASERRKGLQPLLVLLTDGGANIGRDGNPGRAAAAADALAAARACRDAGIAALVVDTAPRPQAFVARLAAEMGAKYLPLPYADAAALTRAVQLQGDAHVRRAA